MEEHKDEVADIDEAFSDLPRFQEDSKIWHVVEVFFIIFFCCPTSAWGFHQNHHVCPTKTI